MSIVKIIVTTEEELASMIAREVEKCFDAKSMEKEEVTPPTKKGNYSSIDLQEMFCISTTTIWNWQNKGLLKPVTVDRKKVFLKEDIERLIQLKKIKRKAK